jgi:SAM-dependent methyltransferase
VKEANRIDAEHRDLTQQVWFAMPQDIQRKEGHPAPFPEKLPARLIALYTFGATEGFAGEIILDPFCGTGTTCAVAKRMGRRWVGIDINPAYVEMARERVEGAERDGGPQLLCGFGKWPSKAELEALAATELGNAGREKGEAKHKRQTYGRAAPVKAND